MAARQQRREFGLRVDLNGIAQKKRGQSSLASRVVRLRALCANNVQAFTVLLTLSAEEGESE